MQAEQLTLTAKDGHPVHVRSWFPEVSQNSKGLVHISHGMAEHGGRYAEFAEALVESGYTVYAHDHRGHGLSANGKTGIYSEEDGWKKVLADMQLVEQHFADKFPELPVFLLGHSMGSFISMAYVAEHRPRLSGLVLSGSNYEDIIKYRALLPIIRMEKLRIGPDKPSPIIKALSFGSFNKSFKPTVTEYDWLSRDHQAVQAYIEDPLSGFFCGVQLWEDMVHGLINISSTQFFDQFPKELPLFLFAGEHDPVGNFGKGVRRLAQKFIQGGSRDIALRLYREGRHEMLNEINRLEVYQDIIDWITHHCPVRDDSA